MVQQMNGKNIFNLHLIFSSAKLSNLIKYTRPPQDFSSFNFFLPSLTIHVQIRIKIIKLPVRTITFIIDKVYVRCKKKLKPEEAILENMRVLFVLP